MVATVSEDFELRSSNARMERPGTRGMDLVKLADGYQRGDRDLIQSIGAVPLQQIAGTGELIWSPHRDIYRPRHVLRRLGQRFWVGQHTTEMSLVQHVDCLEILRVIVVPS